MSKSNAFETDLLELVFNATALTGIAENHSSPQANLEVALHTATPNEAGDMTTNEVSYTGYARATVVRSGAGWTVSGNQVENAGQVDFPACTGGTATATHFSVGVPGADQVLYYGALGSSLAISDGITPSFAAGALTIDED